MRSAKGQLQPGVFRWDSEDQPELVIGFRRFHVIRNLINADPAKYGATAPMAFLARLRELTDEELVEVNLDENRKRRSLSPVDLAKTARDLTQVYMWEPARAAEVIGCSVSRISALIALLRLPSRMLRLIHRGKCPESVARGMRGLTGAEVEALADEIEAGAKPAEIGKRVKAEQRNRGKKTGRSLAEVKSALADLDTDQALRLLEWIEGCPGAELAAAELHDLGAELAAVAR